MWQHRKLILIFYRPLFIANLGFDAVALLFLHIWGWHFVIYTLFIKTIGYAILIGYQYTLYNKTYFYYRNAGVTIRKMYLYTFSVDLILFFLMVVAHLLIFQHAATSFTGR